MPDIVTRSIYIRQYPRPTLEGGRISAGVICGENKKRKKRKKRKM
jgi:hypothetical protein